MSDNFSTKQLKAVFLLIDIRCKTSENDKTMYDWIVYNGYQLIIIATKSDKLKRSQNSKQLKIIKEGLNCPKELQLYRFPQPDQAGQRRKYGLAEELICRCSNGRERRRGIAVLKGIIFGYGRAD